MPPPVLATATLFEHPQDRFARAFRIAQPTALRPQQIGRPQRREGQGDDEVDHKGRITDLQPLVKGANHQSRGGEGDQERADRYVLERCDEAPEMASGPARENGVDRDAGGGKGAGDRCDDDDPES